MEMGDIFIAPNGKCKVITYVDHDKETMGFKQFETKNEALEWIHDTHKKIWPHLHPDDCLKCKKGNK